ncbi:MAG: hypothetical protein GC179_02685 [Anaerolineaceae bacterium]|nr:hypothetical protein [Anaerolineaceae bacterium]
MSQNIEIALKQAFSLIEAGDLEDAKAILRPMIESDRDNADVWWLYSHAVTDPETARLALNNVLRIEPEYPDARELLSQLETQQQGDQFDDFPDADKEPVFIPPMPTSIPGIKPLTPRGNSPESDFSSTDDLPDDILGDDGEEAFYRRPVFYIPVLTILLLVALAIVIIKPFAVNSPSSQATEIATQIPAETIQSSALDITPTSGEISTGISTATPEEVISGAATATFEEVSTEIATLPSTVGINTDFAAIATAFSEFSLSPDNPIAISNTNLGATLNVSVCTAAGKEMRELLPKAMETLAKASSNYGNQAQSISVKMIDCTSNSTLLWIGSSIDDAVAFANATISDKDYQAKWRPVTGS